uniref:Uncharacterized protein n=1 Tax=Panagrolaimus superbus TaxID=310955 RepID=A0A914YRC7_9BILA
MKSGNIIITSVNSDDAKTNKRHIFPGDLNEVKDKWSIASDFRLAIENIVEFEKETNYFEGKNILELGFCTGIPSAYALKHGASNATLVYPNEETYEIFIKPTITKNNVDTKVKFIVGDIENLLDKIGTEKFDIILAPELVFTREEYFERIHDMLDSVLTEDGIVIFSGRTHSNSCSGSIQSMLELIKSKNRFDAMDRTSNSLRHDTAPRKFVQLMRKM